MLILLALLACDPYSKYTLPDGPQNTDSRGDDTGEASDSGDSGDSGDTTDSTPDSAGPYQDEDLDGYSHASGDCNDSDSTTYPGAVEVCDGRDNDCNGLVDDGLPVYMYFADVDNDGYGDATSFLLSCSAPPGYVMNDDDCDDRESTAHPGGTEIPEDGIDQDCSGGDRKWVGLLYFQQDDVSRRDYLLIDAYGTPDSYFTITGEATNIKMSCDSHSLYGFTNSIDIDLDATDSTSTGQVTGAARCHDCYWTGGSSDNWTGNCTITSDQGDLEIDLEVW